jgi:hypothetical protein
LPSPALVPSWRWRNVHLAACASLASRGLRPAQVRNRQHRALARPPGSDPFLAFCSSRVSSCRRYPKVILPRPFTTRRRGRSRYLHAARPSES